MSRFDGDDSLEKMAIHAREKNYNFIYAQDPNARLPMRLVRLKLRTYIYLMIKINLSTGGLLMIMLEMSLMLMKLSL